MSDALTRNDDLARRIKNYRKAFGRGLGCRPTALQSAAMRRAATLQAQSEAALNDPAVSINDRVRITNLARRALADMAAILQPSQPERHAKTLGEVLRNAVQRA